ncbi:MAG: YeeE/YedE family protein [Acidobacteria bacterium]|nr:YeeE/YedE family protein [Acidobacteriota bacterium]
MGLVWRRCVARRDRTRRTGESLGGFVLKAIIKDYWSPYVAGVGIGLTLLGAFYVLGTGLGASGALTQFTAAGAHALAPGWTEANHYLRNYAGGDKNPFKDWMVFQFAGVFAGGMLGALTAGRLKPQVEKGPQASGRTRLLLAFAGGTITGVAARLARGCTSGQALSGGAQLALGSWAFMLAVFAGGYMMAYFVRRQWQ